MFFDFSINSREDVIQFLMNNSSGSVLHTIDVPLAQCDFDLEFWNPMGIAASLLQPSEIVTSFSFPQSGISWAQNSSLFFFPTPSIQVTPLSFTFLTVPRSDTNSVSSLSAFHDFYNSQFTSNGSLKMVSPLKRPRFSIRARINDTKSIILVSFTGCYLSYPVPTISPNSSDVSGFTVNVVYDDIKFF